MPKHRFALVLATLTFACGGSGAARLEGKWRGTRVDGVAQDQAADANRFATQMELEVTGDTISVTYPAGNEPARQSGRYAVKRADKAQVVIATDKDGPTVEETFTFLDDKTMKWDVLAGKSIVFAKQ